VTRAGQRIDSPFDKKGLTLARQCQDNVEAMPNATGHSSFSITLPDEVIETMMDLLPCKLYGATRAEIVRSLIQDALKRLAGEKLVRLRGVSE
jgi:hypothetical protein